MEWKEGFWTNLGSLAGLSVFILKFAVHVVLILFLGFTRYRKHFEASSSIFLGTGKLPRDWVSCGLQDEAHTA